MFGLAAEPQVIAIQCQLKVWDSTVLKYVPLSDNNTGIVVRIFEASFPTIVTTFNTNVVGKISGSMVVRPNSTYNVVFEISGRTFGYRTFGHDYVMNFTAGFNPDSGLLILLPSELKIPNLIWPIYEKFVASHGELDNMYFLYLKVGEVKEFERDYDEKNVNIIVEGDSWFDNPVLSSDLYTNIKSDLNSPGTKTAAPAKFLPLQRWGHESSHMLQLSGFESQLAYLLEYLSKYDFDLLLLSCGGNDFALHMQNYFRTNLSATVEADTLAMAMAAQSNLFDSNGSYEAVSMHVLSVVGTHFDSIMWPHGTIPRPLYEDIVDRVFESTQVMLAMDNIKTRIANLLNAMIARGINTPVLAHTYCYPIFRRGGLFSVDYFRSKFEDRGINNKALQTICIKALIDANVQHVLEPLRNAYPGRFDFADLRSASQLAASWDDEMHLNEYGARGAGWWLYHKVKATIGHLF